MVRLEPEILQAVEKPARYTGNEWNEVKILQRQTAALHSLWRMSMK